MSYIAQNGFTKEQETALFDISPAELRALPAEQRVALAFRHLEHKIRQREAFWSAVEGIGSGLLPILTVLGVIQLTRR